MEGRGGKRTGRGSAVKRLLQYPRAGALAAVAGVLMMGYGICRGEMAVVLTKAINICMECIGIG